MATIEDESLVTPVTIEEEMRGSFMDYAMSVIVSRALPDVRDGLKPVHRRILFAMHSEGLTSGKKYSKCAGVVGEVLKKYHPHGDMAVYDSLVRMAQQWNLRYPLIDGQGNFGSIDGDSAAAYRYTECRMRALAEEMLADIEKDTVDFTPNFDESTDEPLVLPSRVPQLLINGAEGIAVGMASKIPPHNLGEVVRATIALIDQPELSVDDLMQFVPGPDFPTAGLIYGASPIREMYHTGRGLLQLRARTHTETIKGEKRESEAIVVDEIPYQVNKAKLVEKIAELVNEKKIEGISRLRDESDRRGMRIVIELKRDAVADVILNQLFKMSPLQKTFGVMMLSICDGRPRVLNLKEILSEFIEHRRAVVIRRTRFELRKARARLHILEGLRIALQNIDDVIALIRNSESTASAREQLMARYALSEIQAQHILDMPLKRLTGLERQALEDEYLQVSETIARLLLILEDPNEVNRVITSELKEIEEKYSDKRRTEIVEHGDEIVLEDLIAEEDMVVSVSHRGYAKRCSPSIYRAQRRGGKGVLGTKKLGEDDDDFITDLFVASTHAYLLVFTTEGKLHWVKVYALPEAGRTSRGRAIVNILNLGDGEKVSAILPVRHFEGGKFVFMTTAAGVVKRVDLMDFSNVRRAGIRATVFDEGDRLISAHLTDGTKDCILSTRQGMSIRFSENDVRVMGRNARGVRGIMLEPGDEVVNLVTIPEESSEESNLALLTVCENGFGKRTNIAEYRKQSRGGKGIIDIKTTERNGAAMASCLVTEADDVMVITSRGKVIRTPSKNISLVGRNTMGVNIISLEEGEKVGAVARVAEGAEGEGNGEGNGENGNGLDALPETTNGNGDGGNHQE